MLVRLNQHVYSSGVTVLLAFFSGCMAYHGMSGGHGEAGHLKAVSTVREYQSESLLLRVTLPGLVSGERALFRFETTHPLTKLPYLEGRMHISWRADAETSGAQGHGRHLENIIESSTGEHRELVWNDAEGPHQFDIVPTAPGILHLKMHVLSLDNSDLPTPPEFLAEIPVSESTNSHEGSSEHNGMSTPVWGAVLMGAAMIAMMAWRVF